LEDTKLHQAFEAQKNSFITHCNLPKIEHFKSSECSFLPAKDVWPHDYDAEALDQKGGVFMSFLNVIIDHIPLGRIAYEEGKVEAKAKAKATAKAKAKAKALAKAKAKAKAIALAEAKAEALADGMTEEEANKIGEEAGEEAGEAAAEAAEEEAEEEASKIGEEAGSKISGDEGAVKEVLFPMLKDSIAPLDANSINLPLIGAIKQLQLRIEKEGVNALMKHPIHAVLAFIVCPEPGLGVDLTGFSSFVEFQAYISPKFIAKLIAVFLKSGRPPTLLNILFYLLLLFYFEKLQE
jgi:hypothetical protein